MFSITKGTVLDSLAVADAAVFNLTAIKFFGKSGKHSTVAFHPSAWYQALL
ncbi:MAG: hypothetical protein GX311_10925 [Bacteroidales bacterium]|nr:hypothetical protein [Bacteroidales bacterium]